jgi:hypothetical protein
MSVILTTGDVNAFCPTSTSYDDSVIQMYIDVVSEADVCMTSNGIPDAMQKALKLNAICHQLTKQSGGQVKSQRDFEGASITFETYQSDGYGLESSTFGQFVKSSGYVDCFAFMDTKSNRFISAVGRVVT